MPPVPPASTCPIPPCQVHIRERVESMAVFKQFVSTAQREFVASEKRKNPAAAEFRVRKCGCMLSARAAACDATRRGGGVTARAAFT